MGGKAIARLVSVIGFPHNPLIYVITRPDRSKWSADLAAFVDRADEMRRDLELARPDAILLIGNDHLHQLFMGNMPAFLIGKMSRYPAIWDNEVRDYGFERLTIPGDEDLARYLLAEGMRAGIDFSYSDEVKLDHAVVVPLLFLTPKLDVPIVPLLTNCLAPPIPTAQRFLEVGAKIRALIASYPAESRIAVIASGHLSLDLGGPLGAGPGAVDAAFDEQAIGWLRDGRLEEAARECTYDRLLRSGNLTLAFLNFLMAGAIAGGAPALSAEGLLRSGATQGAFVWAGDRP